jgi:hypothetical protein
MGIVLPPADERSGAGPDLAEESGGRRGLSEVDREAVEVEEGLLEGVDVVLVVDVRVQRGGPFQRGERGPGGPKGDQREWDAVDVEGGREQAVELLDGKRARERSGMGPLRGHCGLGEGDAHQQHPDQQWTLSRPRLSIECASGRICLNRISFPKRESR